MVVCDTCHGDGEIMVNPSRRGDPQCAEPAVCPDCHGTGLAPRKFTHGDRVRIPATTVLLSVPPHCLPPALDEQVPAVVEYQRDDRYVVVRLFGHTGACIPIDRCEPEATAHVDC